MANRFLEFYNAELGAIRERAGRFATAYPKIAGRLRLAKDTADDPHVERLIQSFAYTAARVRQKIDDSLPELTDSLLETLYPHYLAPIPALSIVSFAPAPDLDAMRIVPRGTDVTSEPIEGDTVRFTTTQDTQVAPIRLTEVRMMARPFEAPPAPTARAGSCLRLAITPSAAPRLNELGLDKLRLYLSGPAQEATALARLLFQHCKGVTLAAHAADPEARRLDPSVLRPVGFEPDAALFPYPDGSFQGYRMLSEFSALPEKFLFFDIALPEISQRDRLDLYLYFDIPPDDAVRSVGLNSVTLFATPVVNLFRARAEPVALDGTRSAYPLAADARRPKTRQVHSVRRVTLTDDDGAVDLCQPFFHRLTDHATNGVYWHLRRHSGADGAPEGSTTIAFVDARQSPASRAGMTASVEVLATNGALPRRLPYGGGQPRLRIGSSIDFVSSVFCLRAPTPPRATNGADNRAWRLMSHLSLNHLSLSTSGAAALKDILRLYATSESPETGQMIDAIDTLQTQTGLGRVGGVTVTGTDVTLVFEDSRISPGQAVLFASVLDRFLGCYTSLNTFTRLSVRMKDRSDLLARFPARAGEEALI
ncbi:type VI secretion system baseplate subunit TssF [Thalassococcus sp. S3]|uniref:type VI secretion system baseplate subunit TssF n=1 Tax=Thalassococcus sp. S3 TaxID=2017482 RepID=UPI0013EE8B1B|nr:type VI secretion system baseplate subunit TssF [Thalassococcus sp. S3]